MTTDPGVTNLSVYRVACQAGGLVVVNDGAINQAYAGQYVNAAPGWLSTQVNFTDGRGDIDGLTWGIYYELSVGSPTALSGTAIIVDPNGIEYRYPCTALWLGP